MSTQYLEACFLLDFQHLNLFLLVYIRPRLDGGPLRIDNTSSVNQPHYDHSRFSEVMNSKPIIPLLFFEYGNLAKQLSHSNKTLHRCSKHSSSGGLGLREKRDVLLLPRKRYHNCLNTFGLPTQSYSVVRLSPR